MLKKLVQPDEKVPLKLTATERKMVLDDLMIMDQENEQAIRETPTGEPVMMTLGDLDDFIGYIAAEANHTEDKRLERKLDRIYDKVQGLLDLQNLPGHWISCGDCDCSLAGFFKRLHLAGF